MAKRFISTEIFSDEWFMELNPSAKLLYIYLFVNCDHAGIIKLNMKLAEFQTKIKSMETVIKDLGNRLYRVDENIYFLTRFIPFQYPNFPNSKVQQQKGVLDILKKYNFINIDNQEIEQLPNSFKTVLKELINSYDNDNGNEDELKRKERKSFNINNAKDWLKKEIEPFVNEFGKEICNSFFVYWSESDLNKTFCKFQKEKTWETELRLIKWRNNNLNGFKKT